MIYLCFAILSQKEIDYLKSNETLILPEPSKKLPEPQPDIFGQIDSDECWSDWSGDDDNDDEPHQNPIPELCKRVAKIILRMKRKTVPKLNWSCPSDAVWQSVDNTLRCFTVNEIFILLKSSDKINHDMAYPFENCVDCEETDVSDVEYNLAIQAYAKLQPASEFRCFIRQKKIVAICSRDTTFHDDLGDRVDAMWTDMIDFVQYKILPKCPLPSFVVDIYRKIDEKFWIFGFNPFSQPTDSLYFSWDELEDENFGENKVEFRYNDGNT